MKITGRNNRNVKPGTILEDVKGVNFMSNKEKLEYLFSKLNNIEEIIEHLNSEEPEYGRDYDGVFLINDHSDTIYEFLKDRDEIGNKICDIMLDTDAKDLLSLLENEGSYILQYAPKSLTENREFMMNAVKSNGNALFFASDELKNDYEIVFNAVKSKGESLEFAPLELRNNCEIALQAIKKNKTSLSYIGNELRNNRKFLSDVIRVCPNITFPSDIKIPFTLKAKNSCSKIIGFEYRDNITETHIKDLKEYGVKFTAVKDSKNKDRYIIKYKKLDRDNVQQILDWSLENSLKR